MLHKIHEMLYIRCQIYILYYILEFKNKLCDLSNYIIPGKGKKDILYIIQHIRYLNFTVRPVNASLSVFKRVDQNLKYGSTRISTLDPLDTP